MTDEHGMVPSCNLPMPDPTHLTTRQLLREIATLKEIVFTKLESSNTEHALIRSVIEARLNGIDKATMLLQDGSDKLPAHIDEKISASHDIHEEKFASIQVQFRERDVRTEQSSKDSKVAVDAALQAAKEAVGKQNESSDRAILKSEAAVMKQIDQIMQLINGNNKAVDDKINDVKERLTRAEGNSEGKTVAGTSHQTSSSFVVTVVSVVIAFASVLLAIAMAFKT